MRRVLREEVLGDRRHQAGSEPVRPIRAGGPLLPVGCEPVEDVEPTFVGGGEVVALASVPYCGPVIVVKKVEMLAQLMLRIKIAKKRTKDPSNTGIIPQRREGSMGTTGSILLSSDVFSMRERNGDYRGRRRTGDMAEKYTASPVGRLRRIFNNGTCSKKMIIRFWENAC